MQNATSGRECNDVLVTEAINNKKKLQVGRDLESTLAACSEAAFMHKIKHYLSLC